MIEKAPALFSNRNSRTEENLKHTRIRNKEHYLHSLTAVDNIAIVVDWSVSAALISISFASRAKTFRLRDSRLDPRAALSQGIEKGWLQTAGIFRFTFVLNGPKV